MHNNHKLEEGGIFRPSARKNIHFHSESSFVNSEAMGGYGLNNPENGRSQSLLIPSSSRYSQTCNDNGCDEVDNVMSKMVPSSPLMSQRKERKKRNSLSPVRHNISESDDSSKLAKSLPTNLLSHSHSSEEFNEWSDHYLSTSVGTTRSDTSRNNRSNSGINNDLNTSSTSSRYETSPPTVNTREKKRKQIKAQEQRSIQLFLVPVIAVLSILGVLYADNPFSYNIKNTVIARYDKLRFYSDMDQLGNKYKVNDNEILMVQAGISTVYENQDTGSFIFIYDSKMNDFNPDRFENFVDEIAFTAAKYLRNESKPIHYIAVDSSQLDMKTHSDFIQKYREDVARTGVMLVKEMDKVPPALAMAFHYYCDEYNPLIKRSAIFFTLDLANCSHTGQKTNHARIENCLMEKWHGVPIDNVKPLLTRVISVVVDVSAVF